ncbi:DUF87 domain-containing protein [Candidatus Saccharibacteria bacterium]|nr:DUF87 domain-containing protein [Candidatus Saccharibacteria bacterium]
MSYLLFSVGLLVLAITLLVARFVYGFIHLLTRKMVYLEIIPPAFQDKSLEATDSLFGALHKLGSPTAVERLLGKKHIFSVEIHSSSKQGIRFIIAVPDDKTDTVEKLIHSFVPDSKTKIIDVDTISPRRIFEFRQSKHFSYPIQSFDMPEKDDPLGYITGSMTKLKEDERAIYQLTFKPVQLRQAKQLQQKILRNDAFMPEAKVKAGFLTPVFSLTNKLLFAAADAFSAGVHHDTTHYAVVGAQRDLEYKKQLARGDKPVRTLSYFEHEVIESVNQKLKRPLFDCRVRFILQTNQKETERTAKRSIVAAIGIFDVSGYQKLSLRRRKFGVSRKLQELAVSKRLLGVSSGQNYFSANELSRLYHVPHSQTVKTTNVIKSLSKTLPAPVSLKQNENLDVLFGENLHHGQTTAIGLTAAERERHMYIIGGTGNGKTTMLKYMISQDIKNNKGVAVVDPHGDLAEELLGLIPEHRLQDVVYISPDDLAYPIGINLLELTEGLTGDELLREKDLITESAISVLRKLFSEDDSGGHRIEYVLRNTIQTALTVPGANLFTIFRLLNDKKYRKDIVNRLEDQDLKIFWKNELGKAGEMQKVKMAAGITAKIGRFLFSASAKRILEQEKSTINFDALMDEGKIVICNFSKGLLGEDTSMLFGVTVLAKLQLASLRRARLAQDNRRPFYVYVDEFQNFATMSFVQMLSEARKYKLYLTMAEQSTQQQQEQRLVDIILANVATVVAFRSGSPADARLLIPLFSPYIEERELANLPAYNFYCRISAIHAQEPLSGVTVLLDSESDAQVAEIVRTASRTKYAKQKIEEVIVDTPSVNTPVSKPIKTRKKSKQSTKRGVPQEELIHG